jgi:RNA polymerase sigma-70 factor, ECF subfamily
LNVSSRLSKLDVVRALGEDRQRCRPLELVGKRVEAGLVTHEVDSPSMNEHENPGRRTSARGVEARRLPPQGEERRLHYVFGKGGVAHDAQRETVGDRTEPVVERAQRLLVTFRARREQIVIGTDGTGHTNGRDTAGSGVTRYRCPVVGTRTVATERTEEQILAQLRDGDEEAFCALVRRHSLSMTRVAMAFVSRRTVAEEVVQETWLNVVRGLDGFEAKSSLRTWIYAILGNCARRKAEQEQRLVPLSELAADEAAGDDLGVSRDRFFEAGRWSGMWSSAVPPWHDLPEERLLTSELRTTLLEAIEALPRMQRAVITLRDVEGWPPEEVCEYLGVADGNQRVLLHRARAATRAAIERHFEEGTERW